MSHTTLLRGVGPARDWAGMDWKPALPCSGIANLTKPQTLAG